MDMAQRIWRRYSLAFRVKVVGEIESGAFDSVSAAGRHYGIGGADTIWGWVRKLGKNHLLGKVVRVETLNERDELAKLKQQVKGLEQALGQTQAENLLNQSYLKLACERLGEEVEVFRKKCVGGQSTSPVKRS
jgi:transposase